MDVVIVLVFVSLALVTMAVLMFIIRVRAGDLEHGDRLSLLPLETDESPPSDRARDERGSGGEAARPNGGRVTPSGTDETGDRSPGGAS